MSYPRVPETSSLARYMNEAVRKEAYELHDTFVQEMSTPQEELWEEDGDLGLREYLIKGDPNLERSDYVTIVITVPETHADALREAMGRAGAGKIGDYSYCSYSVKGTGRFMPNKGATPYLGTEGVLEEVIEERIETVCSRAVLEHVLEEIKKAHPYEETVIDIYPVYEMGHKKAKRSKS